MQTEDESRAFEAAASVASNREFGDVTVLHDDKPELAAAVETFVKSSELVRDTTVHPELAIRGELEHHLTSTLRVEHVGELPGSKIVSEVVLLDEVAKRTTKSTALPLNWALNLAASISNVPMSLV
jgi:hypothetical protein